MVNSVKRWILAGGVAACAVAVALAFLLNKPRPANLLIISLDTVRPDHLGCYGNSGAATPTLDRLAAEGVVFDDALTSVPLTIPSHTSLLTGLSPLSHAVRDNSNFRLEDDFVTIAEVLRANGYATGAVVGAYVLDSIFGLSQGFDAYDDDLSGAKQVTAFGYPERPANEVTDAAIKWLEGVREPFFLFAHYYDAHAPYAPPEKYRQVFADQPYDGEIAYADEQVGVLLQFLERRKALNRTWVVIVSDHGEGLGDHSEPTHGLLLYDATVKVVLIVKPPKNSPLAGRDAVGKHCGQTAMLIDVFPTVLEALGFKQTGEVDGRSLVPALRGGALSPRVSYIEALCGYFAYRWSPLRGIRFNQWKYIFGPEEELYNLEDDPGEQTNLAVAAPERVAEMKAVLIETAREEPRSRASQIGMTAEEARKLRALGYVSPSPAPVPQLGELTLPDPKQMMHLVADYLEPGNTAFDEGKYNLSLEMFTKFTEADPGNPEGHLHRGRVLQEIGDYGEAVKAYNRVLEIDPVNSGAYFHLGIIAQAQGDPDQALARYQKALELVPGSPEALANIGSALLEKGLGDSAVAVLHRALAANPHHTVALTNLGLAYAAGEMPDSALVYFKQALAVDPADVKALVNCAAMFLGKAEIDSATVYFERARDAAPGDKRILVNLGGVYRQKGLLDRAGQCYEQVLQAEPGDLLALFGLAGVRMSQGRRDQAAALVKRILEIDPDFQPAVEAARRLGLN
jgi:choline-sulfatase